MYDLIIIGCGAAGAMAASHTGELNTLVLEGSQTPMNKLEISGSGRCNLTHSGNISEFFGRYGKGNDRFVRKALSYFDNNQTLDFFHSIGVETQELENGKIFPKSQSSKVISQGLLKTIKAQHCQIMLDSKVISAEQKSDVFHITTSDSRSFKSKYLLICGGGMSFYKTGSDGSCFKLAKSLGHSLNPPKPCLTPVYLNQEESDFVSLAGTVLEDGRVSLISRLSGEKQSSISLDGQLLFTHRGLSGPLILDGSRYINPGDSLYVNFSKDNISPADFEKLIVELGNKSGSQMISTFIKKNAKTQRVGEFLLDSVTQGKDYRISELPKALRKSLSKNMCSYEFKVHSMGGYEVAMATHGGVSLKEINPKTMESRIVKNLFFAGEVMDIDGDTGGYNIQWAFSTAVLAVDSIKSHKKQLKS